MNVEGIESKTNVEGIENEEKTS